MLIQSSLLDANVLEMNAKVVGCNFDHGSAVDCCYPREPMQRPLACNEVRMNQSDRWWSISACTTFSGNHCNAHKQTWFLC